MCWVQHVLLFTRLQDEDLYIKRGMEQEAFYIQE